MEEQSSAKTVNIVGNIAHLQIIQTTEAAGALLLLIITSCTETLALFKRVASRSVLSRMQRRIHKLISHFRHCERSACLR